MLPLLPEAAPSLGNNEENSSSLQSFCTCTSPHVLKNNTWTIPGRQDPSAEFPIAYITHFLKTVPGLKKWAKTNELPSFIAFLREYIALVLIKGSRSDPHSLIPFLLSQNQTVEYNKYVNAGPQACKIIFQLKYKRLPCSFQFWLGLDLKNHNSCQLHFKINCFYIQRFFTIISICFVVGLLIFKATRGRNCYTFKHFQQQPESETGFTSLLLLTKGTKSQYHKSQKLHGK